MGVYLMWNDIRSSLVSKIGADNLCSRCLDSGCEISLADISENRIVVNADKAMECGVKGAKKCDCVLFVQGESHKVLMTLPIELKSGSMNINPVLKQLAAGARYAEAVVRFVPMVDSLDVRCLPVLAHNGRLTMRHTQRLNRLGSCIQFRERKWRVGIVRCEVEGDVARLIAAQG